MGSLLIVSPCDIFVTAVSFVPISVPSCRSRPRLSRSHSTSSSPREIGSSSPPIPHGASGPTSGRSGYIKLNSPVCQLDLELDGQTLYSAVIVDLMYQQPQMYLDHMGVKDGSVVEVSRVKNVKWELRFPEPINMLAADDEEKEEVTRTIKMAKVDVELTPSRPEQVSENEMEYDDDEDDEDEESEEYSEEDYSEDESSDFEEEGVDGSDEGFETSRRVPVAKFQCPECGVVLRNARNLLNHWEGAHAQKKVIINCPKCEFTTSWLHSLRRHLKQVHKLTDEQTLPMKKQAMSKAKYIKNERAASRPNVFKQSQRPKASRARQSGSEGVICEICGMSSSNKPNYTRHFKIKHEKTTEIFSCKLCGKRSAHYKWFENLTQHLRRNHDDLTEKEVQKLRNWSKENSEKVPNPDYVPL